MKRSKRLLWIMTLGYFITYLVRNCYAAVLVSIISDLQISRQLASIAVTGAFFSYGLGQFVSGNMGDRFQPHRIVLLGLLVTSCINLLVAWMPNVHWMNLVWISSGFFHSLIWPSIVRMSAAIFPRPEDYRHAVGRISQGGYLGQIAMILLASIFVAWFSWRALFVTTGLVSLAFSFLWYVQTRHMRYPSAHPSPGGTGTDRPRLTLRMLLSAGLLPILLTTLGIGFLRDGIGTWMPVYFTDVFQMDEAVSLLTSVILPVCGVFIVAIVEAVTDWVRNDMVCTAVFASGAAAAGVLLFLVFGQSAFLDLFLMALISCCVRGCSMPVTCYLPRAFEPYGKVATVSGLVDGIVYMGSAAASYILALLADRFGWRVNLGSWTLVAAVCLLCSLRATGPWHRFCSASQADDD